MFNENLISVSSTINSTTFLQKGIALAKRLDLPFHKSINTCLPGLVLTFTDSGLQLLQIHPGRKRPGILLFVDFVRGKNNFRLSKNFSSKQPLARAAGIKPGIRPTILDGTAGLGVDAFVLASLGCRVTLSERSPILAALLEDGLSRANSAPGTTEIVQRMQLIQGDSKDHLRDTAEKYDTIYLDPMYPHRQQSALSKQPLRVMRTLIGQDQDTNALLEIATQKATNRVAVKRSLKAPLLSELQPSHSIYMKKSRFDIYLTSVN